MCDFDFPFRFEGEPVSMSRLMLFSGDRPMTVARRARFGLCVIPSSVAAIFGAEVAESSGKYIAAFAAAYNEVEADSRL